jgi:hypothetical protein
MKKSTKAALLSGLIFPGVGHMYLKQYPRGSALILAALIAMTLMIIVVVQSAQAIVDRINSGEIAIESGAIADMVSSSTSTADSSMANISLIVLGICWLVGIIDSYRLGSAQE